MAAFAAPLAPVIAPGAVAQAATVAAASFAYFGAQYDGFRRSPPKAVRPPGLSEMQQLVAAAIEGSKTLVASLPNPLGPPPVLQGLAAVAAWIWGLLNNPRGLQWPWPFTPPTTGSSPEGIGVVIPDVPGTTYTVEFPPWPGAWAVGGDYGFVHWWEPDPQGTGFFYFATQAITADGGLAPTTPFYPRSTVTGTAFPVPEDQPFIIRAFPPGASEPIPVESQPGYVPRASPPQPLPETAFTPAPEREPIVPPQPLPTAPPAPVRDPEPLPLPIGDPGATPSPAPPLPGPWSPAPGPTPAPGPSPYQPAPQPPGDPLTNSGEVAPAPAPVIQPTPADAHFPVPGLEPVTGNGPEPTLVGIARELGRLEQKAARMMNNPWGEGPGAPKPDRLRQLAEALFNLLLTADDAGGYGINSPCNKDEEGQQLPDLVASWGASVGQVSAMRKRLDALAQLMQYQKDLPQPTCRKDHPAPSGEFVSVNFEEI